MLVRDGAIVSTSTSGAGTGGDLNVNANKIEVIGTSSNASGSKITAQASENATGRAGNLTIKTGELIARDGGQISAGTFGAGEGGNLNIDAGTIEVIGTLSDGSASSITAQAGSNATGRAGNLTIKTGELIVRDTGQVSASTFGAGEGGNLNIDAISKVELIGVNTVNSNFPSGLFAQQGIKNATGNAGSLIINTPLLRVLDGAIVSTSTFGAGTGGDLNVNANKIEVIGTSSNGFGSIISTQTESNATGRAGNLTIKTGELIARDGGQVSASTFGAGKGGNLNIDATSKIELIGVDTVNSNFPSGLFAQQGTNDATGNAGNLTINTPLLRVLNGATVNASTFGAGTGGDLKIDAGTIEVIGTEVIGTLSNAFASSIVAKAELSVTGRAGNLTIKTGELIARDGGQVSAGTFGAGKGGNLIIDATSKIELIGRNTVNSNSPSGLFAQQDTKDATGNAGSLIINTPLLRVLDGATVSTSTSGAGTGGDLKIDAGTIEVIGTSSDGYGSRIAAQANENATGNAGNLTIKTDQLVVRDRARIAVQSLGTAAAGNLTIDANSINLDNKAILTANTRSNRVEANQATININSGNLILRRGSSITTNALGSEVIGGNINIDTDTLALFESSIIAANSANSRGGNVNIKTQGLFRSPNSTITASGATREESGNVNITTLADPSKDLVPLTVDVVDVARLVDDNICVRTAKSSFTFIGRGGIPSSPDTPAVSNSSWEDWRLLEVSKQQQRGLTARDMNVSNTSSRISNQIVEAQGWVIDFDGSVILTAAYPVSLSQNNLLSQCQ